MKITSFKVAACFSVLIHGGIAVAYYELRHEQVPAQVNLQTGQVTVLEVLSDPVDTPEPMAVKTEMVPNVSPLIKPISPPSEIKPPAPVQAVGDLSPVTPAPAVAQPSLAAAERTEPPAAFVVDETESSSPANYLFNPRPVYPAECRKKKQDGLVIVAVQVSREGLPEQVQIIQSSNVPMLDEAAAVAVGGWRFSPAHLGNVAVASQIEVPIRFKLSKLK